MRFTFTALAVMSIPANAMLDGRPNAMLDGRSNTLWLKSAPADRPQYNDEKTIELHSFPDNEDPESSQEYLDDRIIDVGSDPQENTPPQNALTTDESITNSSGGGDSDGRKSDGGDQDSAPCTCGCWWDWIFSWQFWAPITIGAALPGTFYKLAHPEKPGFKREPLEEGNHWGHTAQGVLFAALLLPHLWTTAFKFCGSYFPRMAWCNKKFGCRKEGTTAADDLATTMEVIQTCGLVGAAIYPAYNLKKRYDAARSGHYEEDGKFTKRIFFDGSFWENQSDYTLGLFIGFIFVAIGWYFVGCRRNSRQSKWRRRVHFPIIALLAMIIGAISTVAIIWGEETVDNLRTDEGYASRPEVVNSTSEATDFTG